MSWNVFSRSVLIATEVRIPTLNFFGGEPLLNPRILDMVRMALGSGFSLMLATNCRPLHNKKLFEEFIEITCQYKDRITIFTARDRFHLQIYDPVAIVGRLLRESYKVEIQDYANHAVTLSEHNANNTELWKMNTNWSCCGKSWTDYLGILPDGGWTICPPSLVPFGDIFSNSIKEITEFKRELPLRYQAGCTECLKDFKNYQLIFQQQMVTHS
jgi:MoaA/NifB/PqqE/SkfB family radical SAM enzyme